jgi:hypothetical protein
MVVRAPLVEAEQHGSIRIQDLTKVVMARRRMGLAEEGLVPIEAARNVTYSDDRPSAFHRIVVVGLTDRISAARARRGSRRAVLTAKDRARRLTQ